MNHKETKRYLSRQKIPGFKNPQHKETLKHQLLLQQQDQNTWPAQINMGFLERWWHKKVSVPQPVVLLVVILLALALVMHVPLQRMDKEEIDNFNPEQISFQQQNQTVDSHTETYKIKIYQPGKGVIYEKYCVESQKINVSKEH